MAVLAMISNSIAPNGGKMNDICRFVLKYCFLSLKMVISYRLLIHLFVLGPVKLAFAYYVKTNFMLLC